MMDDEERTEHATRRLTRFRETQAVQTARTQRMTPDELGQALGPETSKLARILRVLELKPRATCPSPEVLIVLRWAGEVETSDHMSALRIWPYSPTVYAPYPAGGATHGSWSEIRMAHRAGYLTDAEFASLRPLAPTHVTAIR